MMKKLLAMLLVFAMMLSLAACGDEPETTTAPSTDVPTTAPVTTTVPVTTAPVVMRENKLVYASAARFGGDFATGLFAGSVRDIMGENAAAAFDEQTMDTVVGDLLTDYGTLALQKDGTYAYNMTVLSQEPTVVENGDGTRTYTLEIRKDLCYNTGKAITARDYVFGMLFVNSAACPALNGRGNEGKGYPNGEAFFDCDTAVFADIRLVNDYTWTVTVTEAQADYVFAANSISAAPWDVEYWFGAGYAVADAGEGAYLSKDGNPVKMDLTLTGAVSANFRAARSGQALPMVTAGPYQLSSYDETAGVVLLEQNPYYAGNFEGQMPGIEVLEIRCVRGEDWLDALENGDIHLVDTVEDASDLSAVMELLDEGAQLQMDVFHRAGYGKLQFTWDATPTQFVEVRQALAHLIDRQAIVDLYRQGWGSVVDGPYNDGLWMARDSEALFDQLLNDYDYSFAEAERLLEEGGWIYDEYGDPWEGDGLRYKEVSWSESDYMDECEEVGDTILMPLVIKWAASENNMMTDLLKALLVQSEDVANLGMEIRVDEMEFTEMLSYLYRQDIYGTGGEEREEPFDEPYYSMFNLASGWESAQYDDTGRWTDEDELAQLARDMVYGVAAGDRDGYLTAWQDYIVRCNELLPDLVLYADQHATIYADWIQGYDQDTFWGFQNAILYATLAE